MPVIRRLNPGEAALYRALRLEALRESPEAFATTYEAAVARDDDSWIQQADGSAQGPDRATFVVIAASQPAGIAAIYRDAGDTTVGELIQMWIAPEHRGGPLASDLLEALLDWAARQGFGRIRAGVTPGNQRALRFYQKCGFRLLDRDSTNDVLTIDFDPRH
jgi:RimJ/RimL family protein N-acetyltransferase